MIQLGLENGVRNLRNVPDLTATVIVGTPCKVSDDKRLRYQTRKSAVQVDPAGFIEK
jgi:hypothetical protein